MNRSPADPDHGRTRTAGFSLVELLAVILIIAILSSIFLGALSQADRTAKIARTKSLIQKIHNMLMARWDTYRTLRLPINAEAKGSGADASHLDAANELERFRQNVARRRMFAIRELLRMEMPDRYADLAFTPVLLVQSGTSTPIRPYLWGSYRRRIMEAQRAYGGGGSLQSYFDIISRDYESAELLYLILTTGVDDTSVSTEHFRAADIGDKDFDGMKEFHDSWGNPIEFLRWAPGFTSNAQPLFRYHETDQRATLFSKQQTRDSEDPDFLTSHWLIKVEMIVDPTNTSATIPKLVVLDQDDPFNPMRVGPRPESTALGTTHQAGYGRWQPGDPPPEFGFLLIPLIYSYGRDFKSGIDHCKNYPIEYCPTAQSLPAGIGDSDPYNRYNGPYGPTYRGSPTYRGAGVIDGFHYDNITNHDLAEQ